MQRIWKQAAALALLTLLLAGCAAGGAGEKQENEAPAPPAAAGNTAEEIAQPDIAPLDEMEAELYLPNDNADGFVVVWETVDASPEGLVDALIAHGVLPEGTAVLRFETQSDGVETREGDMVSYEMGEVSLTLDLSEEFLPAVTGTGTAGETMVLGSLVNTFLTAYHGKTLTLTCGGEAVETGHAIYDEALTFFDLPSIREE